MFQNATRPLTAEVDDPDREKIERCGNCQHRVALRRPTPTRPASPWRCRRCRSIFLASAQERDGRQFRAGIREEFYFDVLDEVTVDAVKTNGDISPEDLLRLRECLAQEAPERPESRQHRRFPIVAPVTCLPMADDLRIVGEICSAMAMNVSAGGLAIVSPVAIEQPYFAVDFSSANAALGPVLLQRLRTKGLGEGFEIAGRFVSRIDY